ncbi:hypothetical protein CENSYa_0411 [Cenarchaeum symbiosum A]|uniref:Uncharacterized protein n=1 Tax=Cenarchaeum symbiosum (strain A) TaxID=414004 RepID=A0RUM9_CENSY|nr:hypothetical protein CENSYa_0411 [Cenarchaeum symbiosum A]
MDLPRDQPIKYLSKNAGAGPRGRSGRDINYCDAVYPWQNAQCPYALPQSSTG